ncbi:MAG: AI-2E family transporter [Candidatus Tectomicrobia bacterium]|nr:AI-2E family transporter [Candidatus Tectomicrobia bacterium]
MGKALYFPTRRTLNTLLIASGLAAGLILLYLARVVIAPFFVAFILAYILDPLVDRLERLKLPRPIAIIFLLLFFLTLLVLFGVIVYPVISLQVEALIKNMPGYVNTIQESILPMIQKVYEDDSGRVSKVLQEVVQKFVDIPLKLMTTVTSALWNTFSSLVGFALIVLNLSIIPVATFYFLKDIDKIKTQAISYIPLPYREAIVERFVEVDNVLGALIRGQFTVGLILAILYSVGLYIFKTPLGVPIGILAGFASIIPYAGLVLGFLPALLLAFLQFRDWLHPLGVVAVFSIAQFLEGTFITPKVVGDRVGLHPIVIMIAILVGAHFLGLLGIIFAVPMAAVLNVFVKDAVQRYRRSTLFLGRS